MTDLTHDPGLRIAFVEYCKLPIGQGRQAFDPSAPKLSQLQFVKLLQDVGVAEPQGSVPIAVLSVIFASYKPLGGGRLPFPHFYRALSAVSSEAKADVTHAVAALGSRMVDMQYLAAQRVFPDKAYPYVISKASSPPWLSAGRTSTSPGSPNGPSSNRLTVTVPLYSSSGSTQGGGPLARPYSAVAALGAHSAGGGRVVGSSGSVPREVWRPEDFRAASAVLRATHGEVAVEDGTGEEGQPPLSPALPSHNALHIYPPNHKQMEEWGVWEPPRGPDGKVPAWMNYLFERIDALERKVAAGVSPPPPPPPAPLPALATSAILSEDDAAALVERARTAALGAVAERAATLEGQLAAVSEALSDDMGRVITTLSLVSDRVSTVAEETVPECVAKVGCVASELYELQQRLEDVERELKESERARKRDAASDRAALATTTELVNGAVDDLEGLRAAVVELQRELEGVKAGAGGGATAGSGSLEAMIKEVAELRRGMGVRLDSLESQASYGAAARVKAVEEALAVLEGRVDGAAARGAAGPSAASPGVVDDGSTSTALAALSAQVKLLEGSLAKTAREVEAVAASAMRESASLRAAVVAVGGSGRLPADTSASTAVASGGRPMGSAEMAAGAVSPAAQPSAIAAEVSDLRAGQEGLADRVAALEARLAVEGLALGNASSSGMTPSGMGPPLGASFVKRMSAAGESMRLPRMSASGGMGGDQLLTAAAAATAATAANEAAAGAKQIAGIADKLGVLSALEQVQRSQADDMARIRISLAAHAEGMDDVSRRLSELEIVTNTLNSSVGVLRTANLEANMKLLAGTKGGGDDTVASHAEVEALGGALRLLQSQLAEAVAQGQLHVARVSAAIDGAAPAATAAVNPARDRLAAMVSEAERKVGTLGDELRGTRDEVVAVRGSLERAKGRINDLMEAMVTLSNKLHSRISKLEAGSGAGAGTSTGSGRFGGSPSNSDSGAVPAEGTGMSRVLGARIDGLEARLARAEAEAGRGMRVAMQEEIRRLQEAVNEMRLAQGSRAYHAEPAAPVPGGPLLGYTPPMGGAGGSSATSLEAVGRDVAAVQDALRAAEVALRLEIQTACASKVELAEMEARLEGRLATKEEALLRLARQIDTVSRRQRDSQTGVSVASDATSATVGGLLASPAPPAPPAPAPAAGSQQLAVVGAMSLGASGALPSGMSSLAASGAFSWAEGSTFGSSMSTDGAADAATAAYPSPSVGGALSPVPE